MRPILNRFRDGYGAHPLHLAVLLAAFALTGYVVSRVGSEPTLPTMAVWFAAALLGHDLVLFPLYSAADHALHRVNRRVPVPLINHIRVPALASGLLLLLFLPGIIRQGASTYLAATGQTQEPFLVRWLLLTATFFAASAISYAIRVNHGRHKDSPKETGSAARSSGTRHRDGDRKDGT